MPNKLSPLPPGNGCGQDDKCKGKFAEAANEVLKSVSYLLGYSASL